MTTNNYYRANGSLPKQSRYVFFDDTDKQDTQRAYMQAKTIAMEMVSTVSVFRVPLHAGYWDEAQLVGYRRKSVLEGILVDKSDDQARTELHEIESRFFERRG